MDRPSSWTLAPTYKRYIGGKNTIVIILIFVSWLIIATDVLLLLLYFMFPISWDYCIPGSLHCFIFFLIIFCFTTPFLPFFFLCFCQFLFFVYLLFQIGTKEMDWCTLSLVLSLQSPTFWQKGNSCAQPTVVHDGINQASPRIKQHTKYQTCGIDAYSL